MNEENKIVGINKEEFIKAMEEKRVFVTGAIYTKNGWTGFRVFYVAKEPPFIREITGGSLWRKMRGTWCHYVGALWGSSRVLEVILSVGRDLGLEFKEITQNYLDLVG